MRVKKWLLLIVVIATIGIVAGCGDDTDTTVMIQDDLEEDIAEVEIVINDEQMDVTVMLPAEQVSGVSNEPVSENDRTRVTQVRTDLEGGEGMFTFESETEPELEDVRVTYTYDGQMNNETAMTDTSAVNGTTRSGTTQQAMAGANGTRTSTTQTGTARTGAAGTTTGTQTGTTTRTGTMATSQGTNRTAAGATASYQAGTAQTTTGSQQMQNQGTFTATYVYNVDGEIDAITVDLFDKYENVDRVRVSVTTPERTFTKTVTPEQNVIQL